MSEQLSSFADHWPAIRADFDWMKVQAYLQLTQEMWGSKGAEHVPTIEELQATVQLLGEDLDRNPALRRMGRFGFEVHYIDEFYRVVFVMEESIA